MIMATEAIPVTPQPRTTAAIAKQTRIILYSVPRSDGLSIPECQWVW